MLRTTFFVDGFNLYHSLLSASEHLRFINHPIDKTRWLNLNSLFRSQFPAIAKGLYPTDNPRISLENIYYFSAYARHRERRHPGCVTRHQTYVKALQETGVIPELGLFKTQSVTCRNCNNIYSRPEEKETDVAIGIRLAEQAIRKQCDIATIVTGDTDIAPAVRMIRQMCPDLKIVFLFPFNRRNDELARMADLSINLSSVAYTKHQFHDPIICRDGTQLAKPPLW